MSEERRGTEEEGSRRDFLRDILAATGSAAAFLTALPGQAVALPRSETADVLDNPEAFPEGNLLERMRADLQRTLQKPVDQRKWIMVIDLQKCIGCKACTVSCVAENNLPPGVVYRPVVTEEVGEYPNVRRKFLPRPCMHCDNPPCTPVCPVKATYRREDGLVLVRYDRCIGCKACMIACPYNARFVHPVKSVVDKCTFCAHRIEDGRLPACVEACPTRAILFGDLNDTNSEIARHLREAEVKTLKEHLGTDCRVFYANADERTIGRIEMAPAPVHTVEHYESAMPAEVLDAFRKCRRTTH